jgi:hypothetical protein
MKKDFLRFIIQLPTFILGLSTRAGTAGSLQGFTEHLPAFFYIFSLAIFADRLSGSVSLFAVGGGQISDVHGSQTAALKRVHNCAAYDHPGCYFRPGDGGRLVDDLATGHSGNDNGMFAPGVCQFQEPVPDIQTGGMTEHPTGIFPMQGQAFSAVAQRARYFGKKLARSRIWVLTWSSSQA